MEQVTQVEIDDRVIEASKKYLPFMAQGFASPKVTLLVCDGFKFMSDHPGEFDVIITDSSDPIGPAVNLFTEQYFGLLKQALKPNGIICSQGGTFWSQVEHVKETLKNCRKHFEVVNYATASVPTYPTGLIGFVIASRQSQDVLTVPKLKFSDEEVETLDLRYYNSEIHCASFVLPNIIKKLLMQNDTLR